jgi:hypothetical protein
VNGHRVTEAELIPSVSYLPKRVMYNVFDVSHLLIDQAGGGGDGSDSGGGNVIGVWASAAWATYADLDASYRGLPQAAPLVMAEIRVGDTVVVSTDTSWKCRGSTVSHIGGNWGGPGFFGGDAVDDRRAIPGGWDAVGVDVSDGWVDATDYNTCVS